MRKKRFCDSTESVDSVLGTETSLMEVYREKKTVVKREDCVFEIKILCDSRNLRVCKSVYKFVRTA